MTTSPTLAPTLRLHDHPLTGQIQTKLYCFPHAGGSAPFYRSWPVLMPPGMQLCAVQPSGRQDLHDAAPFTDMTALARASAQAVSQNAGGLPFVFFGHSMGALTAFETTRELRRLGLPQPELLAVSGHRAPHLPDPLPAVHTLPDRELIEHVRELGGIPAEVRRSPALLNRALPALRGDFAVLAGYEFAREASLDCPIAAFGGSGDTLVSEDALWAWQSHTSGPLSVELFSGDHFYLTRWSSRIVETIRTALGR